MPETAINWRIWIAQGDQYFKAAAPEGRKSKLNAAIRYNMLSMAFEGYVMAITDFYKNLPENHTYTDLLNALDQVQPIDASLKERILRYENIQSICSIEKYHTVDPSEEDLEDLEGAIREIAVIARRTCVD